MMSRSANGEAPAITTVEGSSPTRGVNCAEVFSAVHQWAERHSIELLRGSPTSRRCGASARWSTWTLTSVEQTDLVITAGGDGDDPGVVLELVAPATAPVLGVNVGRLGFLAEVEPPRAVRCARRDQQPAASRSKNASRSTASPRARTRFCRSAPRTISCSAGCPGRGQAAFSASVDSASSSLATSVTVS